VSLRRLAYETQGGAIIYVKQGPEIVGKGIIQGSPNVPDANSEGPLYGEILVFTGALSTVRHTAAVAAAKAGCQVNEGITKHTTLLVVGDQDIRKLAGHEKSSKHRKAEELIRKGQRIRILGESDFKSIIGAGSL
jgi:DNA polymerase III subunit epsilon